MFQQNPFRMIGSFAPSSKHLAQAMIKYLDPQRPQRILEVGAGTGAITKEIAQCIGKSHHVDVVEIFPSFAGLLKRRFRDYPNIEIHCQDILQLKCFDSYDIIFSSLPFNSLPAELTKALIEHLIMLAKDGAMLSFFEYKGLSQLVSYFLSKNALNQYKETRGYIDAFIGNYQIDQVNVKFNIPPALVHYLNIDKNGVGNK